MGVACFTLSWVEHTTMKCLFHFILGGVSVGWWPLLGGLFTLSSYLGCMLASVVCGAWWWPRACSSVHALSADVPQPATACVCTRALPCVCGGLELVLESAAVHHGIVIIIIIIGQTGVLNQGSWHRCTCRECVCICNVRISGKYSEQEDELILFGTHRWQGNYFVTGNAVVNIQNEKMELFLGHVAGNAGK